MINEHNGLMCQAWHIEALRRAKKLPKLDKLLVKQRRPRQSWQEQMQIMSMWAAAMRKFDVESKR